MTPSCLLLLIFLCLSSSPSYLPLLVSVSYSFFSRSPLIVLSPSLRIPLVPIFHLFLVFLCFLSSCPSHLLMFLSFLSSSSICLGVLIFFPHKSHALPLRSPSNPQMLEVRADKREARGGRVGGVGGRRLCVELR